MKELNGIKLKPIEERAETDISKAIPGKRYWVDNGVRIEVFLRLPVSNSGRHFGKIENGNTIIPNEVVYFFPYQG